MAYQNNYEPMDIDLSAHSNNAMDISFNSSSSGNDIDAYLEADDYTEPPAVPTSQEPSLPPVSSHISQPPTNLKKFYIIMQKEKNLNTISLRTKVICSFAIILLSLLTYQVLNIQCSHKINPDELKRNLMDKLFGQSQAINSLIEALRVEERSKILFIYGGTGVGKTYAASLILDHVGRYSNVYHYIMPSFMETFTTDFMIGLSVCKHTTIVIDDLSAKDLNVRSHINDVMTKSQNMNKDITIILIYTCDNIANDLDRQCNESFTSKLLINFNYIDAFKKLIKFEPLKEEQLKQCIETELGNKRLSSFELDKFLKNFNVSLDGCKGVYKKMKMLEIS